MKIGLLGGSFDPVHQGHLQAAKLARKALGLQEVWFEVAPDAPLKKPHDASFADRCRMVSIAIRPYRHFKLRYDELTLPQPSYTINLVRRLKQLYPSYEFVFIIGDDQYEQFDSWKDSAQLKQLIPFVIINRYGIKIKDKSMISIDASPHPANSTAIRQGDFRYLPYGVAQYLLKHQLYLPEILAKMLSKERFHHSKAVAELAGQLAKSIGYNQNQAMLAGWLHDAAKELSPLDQKKFGSYLDIDACAPPVLHQYLAAVLCKKEFLLQDRQVLRAISHHTTGESCSTLGKILYCADKTDTTRNYPDVKALRALCFDNLEEAFRVCKREVARVVFKKEREV